MVLITGATGTVGKEVIKRLSTQGVQARAVTRDLSKVEASRLPHVQFIQRDFEDPDSMRRACTGAERAFLLSNSTERAEQQQIAFVEVAKQSGVRHIVKLSQLHADLNSTGRFLRYHAIVEATLQAAGLTFTFLRPNLYMQGLLNFRQSIKEKSAFFAAAGEAHSSAVDVRDLADVAVAARTGSQHDNKVLLPHRPGSIDLPRNGTATVRGAGSDHYVCRRPG
jgi:uncharacterized protein YbjT (DUF2867 family)